MGNRSSHIVSGLACWKAATWLAKHNKTALDEIGFRQDEKTDQTGPNSDPRAADERTDKIKIRMTKDRQNESQISR